ncbi:hypothetical protein GC167_00850 [bacterium]|nr:hypothetical protein [bacterium]
MNTVILALKLVVQNTLVWAKEFKSGNRDYSFDVDNELYQIAERHNVNFEEGDLQLVYNVLDFYCDAIEHGFKEISRNYPLDTVESDIREIFMSLEKGMLLDLPNDVRVRLKKI